MDDDGCGGGKVCDDTGGRGGNGCDDNGNGDSAGNKCYGAGGNCYGGGCVHCIMSCVKNTGQIPRVHKCHKLEVLVMEINGTSSVKD